MKLICSQAAYVRVPGCTTKASGIGAHLENMHYCVGSWESLEPDGFYGDEAISTVGSSTEGDKARVAALQDSAGHHASPVAVLTCYNAKIIPGPGCPDSAHLTPVHEHRQRYRDWSSLQAVGVDDEEATLPSPSSDGGAVPDLQIRYPPRTSAASFAKVTEPNRMPPASDNRKLADIASWRSRTDFNSVDSESVFTMDDPVVFSGTAVSVTGPACGSIVRTPPAAVRREKTMPAVAKPVAAAPVAPRQTSPGDPVGVTVLLPPPPPAAPPGTAQSSEALNQFMDRLGQLHKSWGTPFDKIPTVGKMELNLLQLFTEVVAVGGMAEVVRRKHWKAIASTLKLPASCTDYGFRLRKHYERFLLPYETHHMPHLGFQSEARATEQKSSHKRRRKRPSTTRALSLQRPIAVAPDRLHRREAMIPSANMRSGSFV